ncbi:Lysine-specific permease [Psilocybe cubensis]|uniref:Amino acid permease/ SLC12A domain-containing protein n=2 Tax=Psilocybe cubensis TaxID=181762 RepID=A0A8H7XZZ8_PSICU|nr:Lysine-specific permease [Psilocybe cubensis]KAH9482106.1 Lysine-specific permease [Psilocybe cubensis]
MASPEEKTAASSSRSSISKHEPGTDNDNGDLPKPSNHNSRSGTAVSRLWRALRAEKGNETQRGMQSRHLMMIAIGGTIGTGIFLSAGSAIALAGPGSALLSYFVVGLFVYTVVIALGEMSSMYPVSGAFSVFGARFVSPALGFTLGWNYWLQWSLSIPSELTAAAVILQYWTDALQPWHWAIVIIVPIFAIQLIHVRVYGESEYWFAMIKVVMIIFFIIVGLIFDWGGVKGHPGPGLSNFQNGQAFIGGFAAFAQTFVYAFYSFGGIELVAVAAGESAKPYKSVPRAIKATFFRIILFYILTILTIGLCINHADDTLLTAAFDSDVAASPITVVFVRAGFGAAAHVVNAVLLTAVLSATNSCFYASSRMLLSLARSGHAPRVFGWVNSRGVPVPALMMALAFACLTFLTTIWGEGVAFTWLLNITGISALLVWTSIGAISIRFRTAYKAQGRSLKDLPYRQPLYPLLPIGVIILGTLMFVAQGYAAVRQEPFEARNVVATYIGVALYIILYTGYTLYEKYVLRRPLSSHFVPLQEVDLDTDAVWAPGEGESIRAADRKARKERIQASDRPGLTRVGVWVRRYVN